VEQKRKGRLKWLILAGGVLAGAAAAFFILRPGKQTSVQYQTAPVGRGKLSAWVTATGTLSPRVTVQVGSQVSGRILELHADFNSEVKKGMVIARIDPRLFETEVAKAKANLAVAQAGVKAADADLGEAKRRRDRSAELAAKDLVAKAEADTAAAALETSAANLVSAQARFAQAKAALDQAETNLAYTTIVSPIDGVVISRDVELGQTVAASLQAPTLFTLAEDLRMMEVHTSVAESDVGRIQPGMAVKFTVDAYPDRFDGKVKEVRYSPKTVQNVVTYDAVVSVENPENKMRPGMTADVSFLVDEVADALLVPNAALRFRPPEDVLSGLREKRRAERARAGGRPGGSEDAGGPEAGERTGERRRPDGPRQEGASKRMAWKLGPDGQPKPVPVETGISDGKQTAVTSGELSEGEELLIGIDGDAQTTAPSQSPQRARFNRFL